MPLRKGIVVGALAGAFVGAQAGALAAALAAGAIAAGPAEGPRELVANGDFAAEGQGGMPAGWTAWLPIWQKAACSVRRAAGGVLVDAPDEPYAVGGARQDIAGIAGGQAYAVEVDAEVRNIPSPGRSLLVRVGWTRGGKLVHPAGVLVGGPETAGAAAAFRDVLVAPPGADGARLSLEVKWPEGGSVLWKRVSLRPAPPVAPRKVKVGTLYLRPKESTPEKNMDLWCAQVDEAGKLGLDIVCLGEAILQVGTRADIDALAEPIPGPSTERLGAAARKNHLWIVAGLTERDGGRVYNTAVLLDREGRLAGKYRKVHLPREEWQKGITPGGEYPVFKTDFGTIAIQICYDWFFPEPAEIFARRGAEILFAPTWGNTLPDQDGRAEGETVFRVRARDNGLYLVPCVYDGSSMIIDPMGRVLVSNKGAQGVFWKEIDLGVREALPWVGRWRSIIPHDRMPETYGPLTGR
jgi:predicted amidohydrolase